jgi:site-specific recombinase XerD
MRGDAAVLDAGERSDDLGERGGEFTVQGGGHSWKRALRTAGVEPTRANGMHALRHYYASVLLDDGVSIRALAEYLGHADPGFTLRTYTHLMPTSEDRARQAVDAAFSREPDVSQDAR